VGQWARGGSDTEGREMERLCITQPGGMNRVVFEIVAGEGMHQNGEILPMPLQPGNQPLELILVECQLATPARVRPHGLAMDATDRYGKQFAGFLAEPGGVLHGGGIEIDVGVVAIVKVERSLGHGCMPQAPILASLLGMAPRDSRSDLAWIRREGLSADNDVGRNQPD
jgi:hypothetical protein